MFNPFSSGPLTGIVDPQFRDSFDKLLLLQAALPNLNYVAENMEAIRDAANNITRGLVVITGVAPALGGTDYYNLPVPVTMADVVDYSVVIVATNGTLYSIGSGFFTTVIQTPGQLAVTLGAGAPVLMAGGTVRWTLSYTH